MIHLVGYYMPWYRFPACGVGMVLGAHFVVQVAVLLFEMPLANMEKQLLQNGNQKKTSGATNVTV